MESEVLNTDYKHKKAWALQNYAGVDLLLSTLHEYQEKKSDRGSQGWSRVWRFPGIEGLDNVAPQTDVRDLHGNTTIPKSVICNKQFCPWGEPWFLLN